MPMKEETLGPLAQDPVCGRQISEAQALLRAEHRGRTYLFCSERCRMLFSLRPDAFAGGRGSTGGAGGQQALRLRLLGRRVLEGREAVWGASRPLLQSRGFRSA